MNRNPIEGIDSTRCHRSFARHAALALVLAGLVARAGAQEGPTELRGKAALEHPAAKAVLAAAERLAAGQLDEVRRASVREVREEWAALPAAEREGEALRAREQAPDPRTFSAEIEREGILTLYGESGTLRVESAAGEVRAMAFFAREDGTWRVTGGPMTFAPEPVETAPPLTGAAILEHEIGQLVVAYAQRLEAGHVEAARELLSTAARARWAAEPESERAESDAYRRRTVPAAKTLTDQIESGGTLWFYGETASLAVSTFETKTNDDGSVTATSSSMSLGFELDAGHWRLAD